MPSHSERVRKFGAVPAGYQFGQTPWRAPHDNAAEQLARRGWNVIEGESFDSDEERHRTIAGATSPHHP